MTLLAREVRDRCKGHVDERVMYCIEALAEQQGVLRQQINEIAQTLDGAISAIGNLASALGVMKDFVEGSKDSVADRMQHMAHDDDLPPVTE